MPSRARSNSDSSFHDSSSDVESRRANKRVKKTPVKKTSVKTSKSTSKATSHASHAPVRKPEYDENKLALMVNQLDRGNLEKLVMTLLSTSTDCAEIIKSQNIEPIKFVTYPTPGYRGNMGLLGKLPPERKSPIFIHLLVFGRP